MSVPDPGMPGQDSVMPATGWAWHLSNVSRTAGFWSQVLQIYLAYKVTQVQEYVQILCMCRKSRKPAEAPSLLLYMRRRWNIECQQDCQQTASVCCRHGRF